MTLPLVSIVIPNYNDATYVPGAIEAVLSQTYQNLELIVVNDGSTDSSAEIIKSYAEKDERLKFINRKVNRGTNYTVNEGIANATGEYLNVLSANDYILPIFVESCVLNLRLNPEIGVAITDTQCMDVITSRVYVNKLIDVNRPLEILPHELPIFYRNAYLKMSVGNTLVKTKYVQKNGGFHKELACSADWYLITNIAFSTGVIYIPKPLMIWRRIPNCYSQRVLKNKKARRVMYRNLLDDLEKQDERILDLYKNTGELGCILKFSPMEMLSRPKFWPHCFVALKRYIKRSFRKL